MRGLRVLLVCIVLVLALSGAYATHLVGGVKVSCWKQVIRPDEGVDANIVITNDTNTSFQDVNVSWYVEGPSGEIISSGTLYVDFREKETKVLENRIGPGPEGRSGKYTFNAVVSYGGEKRAVSCNFFVEIGIGYYYKTLELLDEEVNNIASVIDGKRAGGYVVFEISSELEGIKASVRELRSQAISGEFGRFDERAKGIYASIGGIYSATKSLGKQQVQATSIILVVFLGIAAVAIVYLARRRKVKEKIVFRDVQRIVRVPKIIRIRERVVEPKMAKAQEKIMERMNEKIEKVASRQDRRDERPDQRDETQGWRDEKQDRRSERQKLRGQLEALEQGRKAGLVGNEAYIKDRGKLKSALKRSGG